MKKILVTGGAGFIGSHICEKLLKGDNYIYCLDNFYSSEKSNIKNLLKNKNFEHILHDIQKPIDLDVDEIYNLACPASPIHYQKDPLFTLNTCFIGTSNILDLAKSNNAKVIHTSTSEVYGNPLISPQNEAYQGNVNPVGIRACYDEGKRVAETLVYDYVRMHNLDVRVARLFNTYGPKMHPNDGRVVSNFIIQAIHSRPLTVYGDGSQTRSFCYVSDIVRALILLMELDFMPSSPINLGNPEERTINNAANFIIEKCKSNSLIEFHDLPSDDPLQRKPDISMAMSKLSWAPEVSFEDGLNKTIAYFTDYYGRNI